MIIIFNLSSCHFGLEGPAEVIPIFYLTLGHQVNHLFVHRNSVLSEIDPDSYIIHMSVGNEGSNKYKLIYPVMLYILSQFSK